jgi:uncharacterized cofD-like protein
VLRGESRISRSRRRICQIRLQPGRVKPLKETLAAIESADLITLGPGSLFTSVIPNLLVDGIPQAIAASPARKAYFMNLMTQPGETTHFRASDHVRALLNHSGLSHSGVAGKGLIDVCVVNTRAVSRKALQSYRQQAAQPVEEDVDELKRMGIKVLATDLLRMSGVRMNRVGINSRAPAEKIRHDSGAMAAVAIELAQDRVNGQRNRRLRRRLAALRIAK